MTVTPEPEWPPPDGPDPNPEPPVTPPHEEPPWTPPAPPRGEVTEDAGEHA